MWEILLWILAALLAVSVTFLAVRWGKRRRAYLADRREFVDSVLRLPIGEIYTRWPWSRAWFVTLPGLKETERAARRYFRADRKGKIGNPPRFDTQATIVVFVHNRRL